MPSDLGGHTVSVPRLEGLADVHLTLEDHLRHLLDCSRDVGVLDLERFAILREPLEVLHVHLALRVAVRQNTWAHEVDHLLELNRAIAIHVEAIKCAAQLRLRDAEADGCGRRTEFAELDRPVAVGIGRRIGFTSQISSAY